MAEALSSLNLGDETPPISPEDIAVSDDAEILNRNPFSSPLPAARASGWGARADSTRKTQGYKAFEVAVPSENPLMTVAVWISETPPDYPEGKPEQDPEADRKFLYLRLQVFIEVEHVALVEGGGVEVLDSEVIVVEEKRPDPKPKLACGTGEFRDGEGSCLPILGADLLCPSGTMPANGLTQAQLDDGFLGAALENDVEEVCEYLRRGANIEIRTDQVGRPHHNTALVIAGRNNYLDLARLLLSNGADVDSTGGIAGGWSALYVAAYEGHADVARVFLDAGANPDVGLEHVPSWTPLHEAAYYNHWRIMKILLTSGANPNIQTARTGWRGGAPLHYVFDGTRSGSALAVSVLVAGGAEVNLRDSGGNSALDLAARGGDAASAEILRAAGGQCFVATGPLCEVVEAATPDPVTLEAVTAETVCESGSLSANGLTQAQLDAGLLSEARDNDLEGVCEYLRRGADVDAHDAASHYLRTALMHSAANGYLELAKLLHANGADLDHQGGTPYANSNRSWRWAALHYAAAAGHVEMARWLLDAGADLEVLSREDRSPLWEAAHLGRLDVVEFLLSRGADPNRAGIAGESAVWGVVYAAVGMVTYRSDWEGWDNGRSHLLAVPSGYLPLVGGSWLSAISLLVSNGADVNAATRFPNRSVARSPLDLAAESGSEKYAALLRGLGGTCLVETGPLCGVVEVATPDPVTLEAVTAETVCESGSLSANGLTQAQLDYEFLGAVLENDLEGACEYLRRGANIEIREDEVGRPYNLSALMIAAGRGGYNYPDMTRLLLANGAKTDARDGSGWGTALHIAAVSDHTETAALILDWGGDVNVLSSGGDPPLYQAAHWGRADMVRLLLSRGADPDIQANTGVSPLHGAASNVARSGSAAVVSLLLSHGAKPNLRRSHSNPGFITRAGETGYSPLDDLVVRGYGGYAEAARILREAGGKCFVRTSPLCGEVHVAVGFSSSGSGTVSAEGGGDALSDGGEVRQGATVMFTATPAAGHYVSGWSGNCAEIGEIADGLDGTAKVCAAAADSDLSVRAEFSEIPSLAGPLCPSGSLSANGLTQAELNCFRRRGTMTWRGFLRRGANIEAQESEWRYPRTALMIAATDNSLDLAKLLCESSAELQYHNGIDSAAPQWESESVRVALRGGGGAQGLCGSFWRRGRICTRNRRSSGTRCGRRHFGAGRHCEVVFGANVHAGCVGRHAVFGRGAFSNMIWRGMEDRGGAGHICAAVGFGLGVAQFAGVERGGCERSLQFGGFGCCGSRGNAEYAELLRGYGVRCFVQTGPVRGCGSGDGPGDAGSGDGGNGVRVRLAFDERADAGGTGRGPAFGGAGQ